MAAKELILKRLKEAGQPLAIHELCLMGYSENNLATRISELAADGLIVGSFRPGTHFKEWKPAAIKFDEAGQGEML